MTVSLHSTYVHSGSFGASCFFFFQAEDGIRDDLVTGVQTCALPISHCDAPSGFVIRKTTARMVKPIKAVNWMTFIATLMRSEERRVGKECRSRWSPYH